MIERMSDRMNKCIINSKDILEVLINNFENPSKVKLYVQYNGYDTEIESGDTFGIAEIELEENSITLILK